MAGNNDDDRGLGERISDSVTDTIADKTGKKQVGFDPAVCDGCPYRGDAPLYPCSLCGCPTISGAPLDKLGMVPDGCPRTDEHERRG